MKVTSMAQSLLAAVVSLWSLAAAAHPQTGLYVGKTWHKGGIVFGRTTVDDLPVNSCEAFSAMRVDVEGVCDVSAQILYNPSQVRPYQQTKLVQRFSERPGVTTYIYSINNYSPLPLVGVRIALSGPAHCRCTSTVTLFKAGDVYQGPAPLPYPQPQRPYYPEMPQYPERPQLPERPYLPQPPQPQYPQQIDAQVTSMLGTVVWVAPYISENGDSTIRIRRDDTNETVVVAIVGSANHLRQTRLHLLSSTTIPDLLGKSVRIEGTLQNGMLAATEIWE